MRYSPIWVEVDALLTAKAWEDRSSRTRKMLSNALGFFSPLTPALSPLRGEGVQYSQRLTAPLNAYADRRYGLTRSRPVKCRAFVPLRISGRSLRTRSRAHSVKLGRPLAAAGLDEHVRRVRCRSGQPHGQPCVQPRRAFDRVLEADFTAELELKLER